jgi:hypothetical protein
MSEIQQGTDKITISTAQIESSEKLTNVIDPNHHCPLGSPFGIGHQVKLVAHVDWVHAAELRDLLVSLLLKILPHFFQYFREADIRNPQPKKM